jgi:hypothetical protein
MNYEDDIRIDETALDVEWLEQPSLMMKYARIAAEARMEYDKTKEALELVKAELDREIRTDPGSFGIEKITETVVMNTILKQEAYQKTSEILIQAKYDLDIAFGAVKAFDARKDALENLVRLNGQQYFAGPKVPRDLSEVRSEWRSKINKEIAIKMNRRKK